MREIALDAPLEPLRLGSGENGAYVVVRHRGSPLASLWFSRERDGATISPRRIERDVAWARDAALARGFIDEIAPVERPDAPPSVTIAICTRNRPALVRRCLAALVAMRDRAEAPPQLLVVDNAPTDNGTREAAAAFPDVRYAMEPVPGLDFGRNRALAEAQTDWIAYVDDDAIVDPGWYDALLEGIAESPEAGGFTAPVAPLALETEAQLRFERAGGFGKGFDYRRFGPVDWAKQLYPTAQGAFGTGASMVFSVAALRALGGFDEALDTGPPLPGGGDIDMFYRIVRSGRPLVYLPGLVVFHEHRADIPGLARQFESWGRSHGALLEKTARVDPEMLPRHRRTIVAYFLMQVRRLLKGLLGRGPLPPRHALAEMTGLVLGSFGEYRRSEARIARRKQEHGA